MILLGKETRKFDILGCGSDPKVGRYLVLGSYANIKKKINFANPLGGVREKWLESK